MMWGVNFRVELRACMLIVQLVFRVKGGENEWFGIDSRVRQGCNMSPWLLNVYMNEVMKEVKMGMGRKGVRFVEDVREWILPGFL